MTSGIYDALKRELQTYLDAEKKIEARREEWKNTTETLILNIFNELVKRHTELRMDAFRSVENHHSIFIGFPVKPSGIIIREDKSARALIKKGTILCYHQLVNGKILAYNSFSFVEVLQDRPPIKSLGSFEPQNITEEKILGHVTLWLNSLNNAVIYENADDEFKRISGFADLSTA